MAPENTVSHRWQDRRSLVHAWLLLFFPIGLYGLWTSTRFEQSRKWQFTGAVAAALVLGSAGLLNLLVAFVGAPLAVFLLWRDPEIPRGTLRNFAIGAGVLAVLALASAGGGSGGLGGGGPCAAVQTYGNCTYYRDNQCNVIGQSCQ